MSNSRKIIINVDMIRPQTNNYKKHKYNLFVGN